MLSVDAAQARISAILEPVDAERIALSDAGGRVLRSAVLADRPQPPFAASAMDGYAITTADKFAGRRLAVIGEVAAGQAADLVVHAGEAVRIFTGAPIPSGADTIVIQEDVDRDGDAIVLRANLDASDYVRPLGADFPAGMTMAAPRRLSPADIALLAAMNAGEIDVARRPIVAIIPTGDELVWPGETPRADQIIASNNFGLKAMLEAEGARVRLLPIAADRAETLAQVLAMATDVDLIVTLGGASVGDYDLVQEVAGQEGLDLAFYKIAMRPGKPLMAGRFRGIPMLGLPGNPVSSMVCGEIFVRPAIRALLGLGYETRPTVAARLAVDLPKNGPRLHYMRARTDLVDGQWMTTPFDRQDSSLLSVLSGANSLAIRPIDDPARQAGDPIEILHLGV